MEIEFSDNELQLLFETSESQGRKYKLDKSLKKQYEKCINKIKSAENIQVLRSIHSLNFEKLQGTEYHSVRVNLQYRLELIVEFADEAEAVCNKIIITHLSNHYGK